MKGYTQQIIFLIFVVVSIAIAAAGFVVAPPQIPIWYSLSISEQQLDQKIFIFIFPLSIAIIALLHTLFIRLTRPIDSNLGKIILWASLIPMSILCTALIHIVLITI